MSEYQVHAWHDPLARRYKEWDHWPMKTIHANDPYSAALKFAQIYIHSRKSVDDVIVSVIGDRTYLFRVGPQWPNA